MVKKKRSQRGQRGNILVFLTLALPFFVGLVGLGIDATMCYIVQTELSAAVDGAALGAGRLLSTNANPTDIANEFLNANFRVGQSGFWGSYNLTPTVTVATGITKTVTVTATANVPLLFMRLLHQNAATVSATATATRRDARIEFVIDRSGSMNDIDATTGQRAIDELVPFAQGFTEGFTNGFDELGLVVFSGSAVVGYPITPWPASLSPTGAGGPDINFYSSSAGGATKDMPYQIGQITAGNGTAMGDALALAYIELQKAHMRDMAADGGIDTRMNAIVLFTDGVPSSVVTYPNQNSNSVIKTGSSGSGCTYPTDTATPSHPIYGYVVVTGSPPYSSQQTDAFYQLASFDTIGAHTSTWWMSNPTYDMTITPPSITPSSGFAGCSSSGWNSNSLTNLSAIPSKDRYGYSLAMNTAPSGNGNGYKLSQIIGDSSATSIYDGSTGFVPTTSTSNTGKYTYQWGLAGWDEVDNVAEAIRSDSNYSQRAGDTSPMAITIFTVGYTPNGGTDIGLLQKIANVAACNINGYSCYNSTQQQGLFVEADNPTGLANALETILTAILRLAR